MEPPAGAAGWLKLLLDAHHSRLAAEQLRAAGYDVVAASDDPATRELSDDDLLQAATQEDRAVVTENARDFDRIARAWAAADQHHAGIVFTSARRYHRGSRSYPQDLVVALTKLLTEPPESQADWVYWLP